MPNPKPITTQIWSTVDANPKPITTLIWSTVDANPKPITTRMWSTVDANPKPITTRMWSTVDANPKPITTPIWSTVDANPKPITTQIWSTVDANPKPITTLIWSTLVRFPKLITIPMWKLDLRIPSWSPAYASPQMPTWSNPAILPSTQHVVPPGARWCVHSTSGIGPRSFRVHCNAKSAHPVCNTQPDCAHLHSPAAPADRPLGTRDGAAARSRASAGMAAPPAPPVLHGPLRFATASPLPSPQKQPPRPKAADPARFGSVSEPEGFRACCQSGYWRLGKAGAWGGAGRVALAVAKRSEGGWGQTTAVGTNPPTSPNGKRTGPPIHPQPLILCDLCDVHAGDFIPLFERDLHLHQMIPQRLDGLADPQQKCPEVRRDPGVVGDGAGGGGAHPRVNDASGPRCGEGPRPAAEARRPRPARPGQKAQPPPSDAEVERGCRATTVRTEKALQ